MPDAALRTKVRAAVLRNTGDDKLEVRDDVEVAPLSAGHVKVDIKATGVCHSDISAMSGIIPQPAPFVPGHEGAGIVAEVGEGVTSVSPGDHSSSRASPRESEACRTLGSTHGSIHSESRNRGYTVSRGASSSPRECVACSSNNSSGHGASGLTWSIVTGETPPQSLIPASSRRGKSA